MMDQRQIVFVESNTSGTGRLFCDAVRRRGLCPVVLCDDPDRYPYLEAGHADFVKVNTADLETIDDTLESLSRVGQLAGIYSTSDYFLKTAAQLARRRSLPGLDPRAVEFCRNKWLQRGILQRSGLTSPCFALAGNVDDAVAIGNQIGYPIVAKPVAGTGSIGVKLCLDENELASHASAVLSRKTNERGGSELPGVLIESYIRGPEFSAEVFNGSVFGLTRKHVSPEPYFVELGHDFPANLTQTIVSRVVDVVERAVQALGITWGPVHVEFKVVADDAVIIEANPRLAGGYIPELIRLAQGVDLIEQTVKVITGEDSLIDSADGRGLSASIRFITTEAEGTLLSFDGEKEATALPGVVQVATYKLPGSDVRRHHDFRDRLGHVLATGSTPCAAAEAATIGASKVIARVRGN